MSLYRSVQQAAATVDARVVIATIIVAPIYALGWLTGRIARTLWRGAIWLYTAARLGVIDGWSG